jgi:hypothetical protein
MTIMADSDNTIVEIPKEHWLFKIPPNLPPSEVKKRLKRVTPKIKKIRKKLSILKNLHSYRNTLKTGELFGVPGNLKSGQDLWDERYSLGDDLRELRSIRNILRNYSKYGEALELYIDAIKDNKKAKEMKERHKICYSKCDSYYPPEKSCPMGYSGGCKYEPEEKKSVRYYKREIIKKMEELIKSSKDKYDKAEAILKDIKVNRVLDPLF